MADLPDIATLSTMKSGAFCGEIDAALVSTLRKVQCGGIRYLFCGEVDAELMSTSREVQSGGSQDLFCGEVDADLVSISLEC